MERMKTARNVAIVLVIAAAVYVLPGGGRAAKTFEAALWVAFCGGIAFLALRFYREQRVTIHSLGDRHRALLFGALAVAAFAWMARARMWGTGLGELAWFVLALGVVWALLEVFRRSRSY
jgi:hypothetical protein